MEWNSEYAKKYLRGNHNADALFLQKNWSSATVNFTAFKNHLPTLELTLDRDALSNPVASNDHVARVVHCELVSAELTESLVVPSNSPLHYKYEKHEVERPGVCVRELLERVANPHIICQLTAELI